MAGDQRLAATLLFTVDLTTTEPQNTTTNSSQGLDHDPPWTLPVKIIYSSTMLIFMILAFFGNLMVLTVIARHKSMRTRTNMFIFNLAITDFLVAILNMPFSLGTILSDDWPFGDVMCQINGFLMPLLFICSEHTLMYMAVHKFFTIYYPFKQYITFRRVIGMIVAAWVCAGILSLLAMVGLNHILYKKFTTQCGPDYPRDTRGYIHVTLMTIFTYIIPMFVVAFSYVKMFIEIRGYSHRLEKHTNQNKQTIIMQQKRAVMTMFIVVVMFVLCWTPYHAYAILSSIMKNKENIPHNFNAFAYLCGYMNSSVNPIIYGLRNKSFRNGYKEFFCQHRGEIISEGDLQASGSHNVLQRMASSLSRQFTLRGQSQQSPNVSEMEERMERNRNERQSLVSKTSSSFRDYAKKVSLSSGAIAYMKNGKIIKIDYPNESPSLRRKTELDDNLNGYEKSYHHQPLKGTNSNGNVGRDVVDVTQMGSKDHSDSRGASGNTTVETMSETFQKSTESVQLKSNLSSCDNVNGRPMSGSFPITESDLEDDVFLPDASSPVAREKRDAFPHSTSSMSPSTSRGLADGSSKIRNFPHATSSDVGDRNSPLTSPTKLAAVVEDTEDASEIYPEEDTLRPAPKVTPPVPPTCIGRIISPSTPMDNTSLIVHKPLLASSINKRQHETKINNSKPHKSDHVSSRGRRAQFWNTDINELRQYSPGTGKKIAHRLPSVDYL